MAAWWCYAHTITAWALSASLIVAGRRPQTFPPPPPHPTPAHLPPGVENLFYEGPLRVRVPVSMQLDADGAFSFDIPLPSAEGAIGEVRRLGLCGRRRR